MRFQSLVSASLATGLASAAPYASPFPQHGVAKRGNGTSSGGSLSDGSAQTVLGFWGQGEGELSDVCGGGGFTHVVLSFITSLQPPTLNLGGQSGVLTSDQSSLWSDVADEITACQAKGIKVMIAFGGDKRYCNSTFASSAEATQAAQDVWYVSPQSQSRYVYATSYVLPLTASRDLFLGGTGSQGLRPFGSGVTLDGIDLDNEAGTAEYYPDFVKSLRGHMGNSTGGGQYYISADPMAAEDATYADDTSTSIPDSLLPLLDWVNVQFYNAGDQSVGGSAFKQTMQTWAKKLSAVTPSPKLLLGIPGGEGEASDGIQTADEIAETLATVQSWNVDGFAGVGIWDCGSAMTNTGFLNSIQSSLGGAVSAPASNSTSRRI